VTQHLDGKRAFLTGGGGAIGRASALAFAREGASIAVDVVADAAQETVRRVVEQGGHAGSIVADVIDQAQAARAVDEAVAALGGRPDPIDGGAARAAAHPGQRVRLPGRS
jgi:NAD(P)-dependent dehydrogenase (short-subunit alcohol dehydrogenase family)